MKRKHKIETTHRGSLDKFSMNQLLLIAGISLVMGAMMGYILNQSLPKEIVHIQSAQVFSSFTLTQELEAKLNNTQQSRKVILENLAMRVQQLTANGNMPDSVSMLQSQYLTKQEQLRQDNQLQAEAFDTQIWAQLNQYIQDFCIEKGYRYILGSSGAGNLMGADPQQDVTESVIAYVNDRYSGRL